MTSEHRNATDGETSAFENHEAHLRQAQAVAGLGSWELDVTSDQLYWSKEVERQFDVRAEPPVSFEQFLEYVHPEDRTRVQDNWTAALDGDKYDVEHRIEKPDGDHVWVRARARIERDADGRPVKAVGVLQDITERKERESRMRMQLEAIESSMEGIAVLDADDEYVFMNQAHADLFGYDPGELVGRSWRYLYDDDEVERLEREVFPVVDDAGEWRGELTGTRRDGSTMIQETTLTRLDGGGLVCTTRDVTERKERERSLRRFKRAIEASSHSIYITDPDGTIQYVNPAFEAVTGYSSEEAIGRTPSILRSDEHDESLYEDLWETILAGETWEGELVNNRKDGTRYVVNQTIAPVTDEDGGITNFVAVNADITELKRNQNEIHKLRQAIEHAQTPLTLTDPTREDNPMVYVNEAFKELSGYSEADLIGENCRLLQGADTDEGTITELRTAIDDEEPITVEMRNYRRDGTMFWNELSVTPVYDSDGSLIRYLGTQRDVTERKEREQQLRVLDRVLRHNLRNDMNAIMGHAETIRSTASPDVASHAETIVEKGTQLLGTADKQRAITNVLLEPPNRKSVAVDRLIQTVTSGVAEAFPDATIDVDCPGEVTAIASSRIGQALEELLTNALEHSDQDEPTVRASVTDRDEHVRIEVIDRGPSIPEMEQQVGTSPRDLDPLYHGSGLGLWLVYWIVNRSDGTVSFGENDPGGNVVQIDLPRASSRRRRPVSSDD